MGKWGGACGIRTRDCLMHHVTETDAMTTRPRRLKSKKQGKDCCHEEQSTPEQHSHWDISEKAIRTIWVEERPAFTLEVCKEW